MREKTVSYHMHGTIKNPSQQELYEQFFEALMNATLEKDIYALNGFMESDVIRYIKRKDVKILWYLCWWSWRRGEPRERVALSAFIASIRALYPWLSLPTWPSENEDKGTKTKTTCSCSKGVVYLVE